MNDADVEGLKKLSFAELDRLTKENDDLAASIRALSVVHHQFPIILARTHNKVNEAFVPAKDSDDAHADQVAMGNALGTALATVSEGCLRQIARLSQRLSDNNAQISEVCGTLQGLGVTHPMAQLPNAVPAPAVGFAPPGATRDTSYVRPPPATIGFGAGPPRAPAAAPAFSDAVNTTPDTAPDSGDAGSTPGPAGTTTPRWKSEHITRLIYY